MQRRANVAPFFVHPPKAHAPSTSVKASRNCNYNLELQPLGRRPGWIAARDHVRAVCPILRRGGQWLSERVIYNLLWLPTSTAANPDKCFNYGLFYICNLSDATKKAPNCIAPTYPGAKNLRQFKQLRIIIIVYCG